MYHTRWVAGSLALSLLFLLGSCATKPPQLTVNAPAATTPVYVSSTPIDSHPSPSQKPPSPAADASAEPNNSPAPITPSPTDVDDPDAVPSTDQYLSTMLDDGYTYVDVTDFNADAYPGSTVYQGFGGDIGTYCLSGSREDAELFWHETYANALAHAEESSFQLSYEVEDLSAPRSVRGTIDGVYFRCDLEGDVCVYVSSKVGGSLADQIDTLFQKMKFHLA